MFLSLCNVYCILYIHPSTPLMLPLTTPILPELADHEVDHGLLLLLHLAVLLHLLHHPVRQRQTKRKHYLSMRIRFINISDL